MREILFRGKRTDNGTWAYGYLFCIWERTYLCWGTTNDVPNMKEVIPETVGQYTGLTDKNGKRIFEGDIIEFHEEIGKIKYSDYDAAFDIIFDTWNTNFSVTDERRIEVIGNIHDNPELME